MASSDFSKNSHAKCDEFLGSTEVKIPSLRGKAVGQPARPEMRAIAAAAVGGLTYLIGPELLDISSDGKMDEGLSGAVALATYFISGLVAPKLCSTKKEQKDIERWNVLRGAGVGASTGFGIAVGLTSLKFFIDIAATGGIIVTLSALGGGGILVYNRLNRIKYCDHCGHKGSCRYIVCRECLKLHFPMKKSLDCEQSISISWYALASQLHYDGLNYCESLQLVQDNFKEWIPYLDGKNKPSTIDCEQFSEWRKNNKIIIASYRNTIDKIDKKDKSHLESIEKE